MAKDLTALKADVQTEMQLDPGLISDSERGRFINACIEDLSGLQEWEKEQTIAVTAGTYEVNLPTDYMATATVLWNDRPLRPIKRQAAPGSVSGTPIGYIEKSGSPNKLELYPKPEQAGSLFVVYRYKGVSLVNATDVPNFHIDVSELLIDFAVARAHRKNGNVTMFTQYMSYYEAKKGSLYDRLLKEYNSRIRTSDINNNDVPLTPYDYL